MKKILFTLAAGTAMASSPAFAQDADSTFSGPRVEAIVGYDINKAGSSIDNDTDIPNDQSAEGLMYGVGAGYDFDLGSVVVGPEAEVTWSNAKTTFEDGDFEGFGAGNVRANRDLYLGARVGFKATPSTLVYAKGGYTNAKFDSRNQNFRRDLDADGWRLGAGVEQKFDNNVYAKVEYRYSNYKEGELDYSADIPDSQRFDLDLDRHQIVAGVGMRF